MKLLLDTHVWAWALLEPERLSARAAAALRDQANELWLSPISSWELSLLVEMGRVAADQSPQEFVTTALAAVPARAAVMTHAVAAESRRFRWKHRDPADRFLVATARIYDLTILTADRRILRAKHCAVLSAR